MDRDIGLATQKAYKESCNIILNSTSPKDCKKKLINWLGGYSSHIDYIVNNLDTVKKSLTKERKK